MRNLTRIVKIRSGFPEVIFCAEADAHLLEIFTRLYAQDEVLERGPSEHRV